MRRCLARVAGAAALLGLLSHRAAAQEPQAILLWPNGAPGSEGKTAGEVVRLYGAGERIVSSVHRPSITPFLPAAGSASGAAVIVMPGGGHRELWTDHEGYNVARWLSDHGIAAFVLKYRLAREEGSTYTVEGHALADVRRAMQLVRSRAAEWHIAPDRIGVLGFSAGGELAALAGTRPDSGLRPAFMALIYPGLPGNLDLSRAIPPAFLLVGENDSAVAGRVTALFGAIRQAGGSAELHVLAGAGHGFGIRDSNPPAIAAWPSLFYNWLGARGMLGAAGGMQITSFMQAGIPTARPVPAYSVAERQRAAQQLPGLAAAPSLGEPLSLTPNAPSGRDGAHLSFWKPSFLVGTPSGGEAGVNFWGIHNEGHVNVAFTPGSSQPWLVDCRLLSAGAITYKVYSGAGESLRDQGQVPLRDGHFLLLVPVTQPGEVISVELWPTPVTETMGFLGCELGVIAAVN